MDSRDFEEGAIYGDLTVGFLAKAPYKTWWLKIHYPVDKPPTKLFEALERIGWHEDESRVQPTEGRESREYGRPGSALFQGWTSEEATANMLTVRRLLRQFKITRVPRRRLTLADLM